MKRFSMILLSLILFYACSPVNITDFNASNNVLKVIGGRADLLYSSFKINKLTKFRKVVDFKIYDCQWINDLKYSKDVVTSYSAYHLYTGLSKKTINDYEAIRISIDDNFEDEVKGKYIYSMKELEFVHNAFSTTKEYLKELFQNQNNFESSNFIKSISLSKNALDSINTFILNKTKRNIITIDLFAFGMLEDNNVAILSMIEYEKNEFHVVRFVLNGNDSKKITYIGK
jgi:hypothetical protein